MLICAYKFHLCLYFGYWMKTLFRVNDRKKTQPKRESSAKGQCFILLCLHRELIIAIAQNLLGERAREKVCEWTSRSRIETDYQCTCSIRLINMFQLRNSMVGHVDRNWFLPHRPLLAECMSNWQLQQTGSRLDHSKMKRSKNCLKHLSHAVEINRIKSANWRIWTLNLKSETKSFVIFLLQSNV